MVGKTHKEFHFSGGFGGIRRREEKWVMLFAKNRSLFIRQQTNPDHTSIS